MRVRLGYVAIAMDLLECSPSKAITATNLVKLEDPEARIIKLRNIATVNLENTLRILKYNVGNQIKLYRLTSKLVPLATHPISNGWDYVGDLKDSFKAIGDFVKENGLRISAHPDHFTLLNSPKEDVYLASLKDLEYHEKVYEAMGLDNTAKLVLHTGGLYKDKVMSVQRFTDNYQKLPDSLKSRITLENDDKVYTAEDVLSICQKLNIPMVLDVHHDRCNKSSNDIKYYIKDIFDTWKGTGLPPKIHISSPAGDKDMRHHADFIEKQDFLEFLYKTREVGMDFDVMIEAKQKDRALNRLLDDLKGASGIEVINGGELEYYFI